MNHFSLLPCALLVVFIALGICGCSKVEPVATAATEPASFRPSGTVEEVQVPEEAPCPVTNAPEDPLPTAFDNDFTVEKLATHPDVYRIRVRQFVEESDKGVSFEEVRAILDKLKLETEANEFHFVGAGAAASVGENVWYDGPFLRLEVVVTRDEGYLPATEVQVTYDTPRPVLAVDAELLKVVLTHLESQLAVPRSRAEISARAGAKPDEVSPPLTPQSPEE